jgi:heterodisulfide reductase subunit B
MTTQAFEVQEKLIALEAMLLADDPALPTHLRSIHKQLKADPSVVTLLSEEECSILVRGLKKHTSTELVTKAKAKAKTKTIKDMVIGLDL